MRTSRRRRILAFALLSVFVMDVLRPTAAYALTGGPSQPEFESFEPVSTDQMVDLFTGDFNYNIPLLTVPGPNGGYPINLAYHAGIGMEQEASWVGLGWNINAGAINRVLRGLPDDFNGDEVTKETRMRPNNTIGFSLTGPAQNFEVLGFEPFVAQASTRFGMYLNNYRGVGLTAGLNVGPTQDQVKKKMDNGGVLGRLSLGFDSQSGLEMVPSISHHAVAEKVRMNTSLSMSFSSNYGLQGAELRNGFDRIRRMGPKDKTDKYDPVVDKKTKAITKGTGFNFASPSFTPAPNLRTTGLNFKVGLAFGTYQGTVFTPTFSGEGSFSTVYIPNDERSREVPAYGYLYADQRPGLGSGLMDFNRDKDYPITRRAPYVPMPVFTHDAYLIKGQGTGGVFRPFRSDVGILTDEESTSQNHGGEVTAEIGTGGGVHFGADLGYSFAQSYGGSWKTGAGAITDPVGFSALLPGVPLNTVDLQFQSRTTTNPLYEPFYFKVAGERTASRTDQWDHLNGSAPVRFDLRQTFGVSEGLPFLNPSPTIRNRVKDSSPFGIPREKNIRSEREKRVQNIEYRTRQQITSHPEYNSRPDVLYDQNTHPTTGGERFDYDNDMPEAHHIGEISVLGPDGTRHIYGLPAYNTKQREVVFSMHAAQRMNDEGTGAGTGFLSEYDDDHLALTPAGDIASWVDQGSSQDRYYSATELPPYVHSYLLTAVVSHDYVDLTGDGPSPDDLGYYAKFNYAKPDVEENMEENWRAPFRGVHFNTGAHSNPNDDKGSYTYGAKKVYYLHSIETKTHYAVFSTSDRDDAKGAVDETNNGGTAFSQWKLDRIDLFSRAVPGTPLKSVVFDYTYELCRGVANQDDHEEGKLTLKSMHFLHMGSMKGSLSKYRFSYGTVLSSGGEATDPQENPGYSAYKLDRWGNYRGTDTWRPHPYVDQTDAADANRNTNASAWCLREIVLPSGGRINVDYESDDYAFVQDKQAMQMFKIVGTSEVNGDCPDTGPVKFGKKDLRIYVDLGREYASSENVMERAMGGITEVYFKTWQRLKRKPFGSDGMPPAMDYVEGYAKVDLTGNNSGICSNDARIGYFTLKEEDYGAANYKVHPFRKAGWQYLRFERPDLLFPPDDMINSNPGIATILASLNAMLAGARMLLGYYTMAGVQGWCGELDPGKPSFVRLNTPSGAVQVSGGELLGKFGGGHRVKNITVTDAWEEGSNTYGKSYEYTTVLPNGRKISSGVAEYEPLLGGEEIALRKPIWYNNSDARISFRNAEAFLEEPLGEALYPGANVGYSRVVVRDMLPANDIQTTANGTTVHEFYTAKDFPVRVQHTDLDYARFSPPPIPIPFIGSLSFNSHGYSQGYAVHLNDMHGKMKAVSTYPHCTEPVGEPKTRVFHRYNTEPGQPHMLSNMANVLTDHFTQEVARLGTTTEFYVDLREHSSEAYEGDFNFNVDLTAAPPIPFALGMPGVQYNQSKFRSVATTKVVHSLGILGEVVNEVDGARATTATLLYDADTGEPLLTTVNNSFEAPVYTYKYAAHMAYEGMGAAFKNWGGEAALVSQGSGVHAVVGVAEAEAVFHLGDEVLNGGGYARAWVSAIQDNTITLRDASNALVNADFATARVVRSGRRNLQSVQNGTIVSLRNPVAFENAFYHIMELYNQHITGSTSPYPFHGIHTGYVCGFNPDVLGDFNYVAAWPIPQSGDAHGIQFDTFEGPPVPGPDGYPVGGANCRFAIVECSIVLPPLDQVSILGLTGDIVTTGGPSPISAPVILLLDHTTGNTFTGLWADFYMNCNSPCFRVLHADATEYSSEWSYDYLDAGGALTSTGPLTPASNHNPYRYGRSGMWRPQKNHLYQVDRRNAQSNNTHINEDGEYKEFTYFNFDDPGSNPSRWVRREEMTRYSPYGFALESRDANNIYSSMLYGYGNSQAVARAANAGYYEVAFDGFEDHGGTYQPGHGHLALNGPVGDPGVSTLHAHSGRACASTVAGQHLTVNTTVGSSVLANWVPQPDKRYTASAWVRANNSTFTPTITVHGTGGGALPVQQEDPDHPAIEGWKKVTVTFTAPGSGTPLEVRFGATGASSGQLFFDDIRIHPADAGMSTYVYHPGLHWLLAELDDRNYATFYNYDEEGTLVQVKKETERGVMTLRTTRKNVVQTP